MIYIDLAVYALKERIRSAVKRLNLWAFLQGIK